MPSSKNGNQQFASKPDAARAYTALGLAVIPSHHPIPARDPDQHERPALVCSCENPACPTPARHTVGGLTVDRATTNTGRVAAWWAGMPDANIAMPAGHMCEVLELHYHTDPEQVALWLGAHHVEPGPILDAGMGRLQFPVRSSEPTGPDGRTARLAEGTLHWLTPATLVLLPPSQTVSGHLTRWARPFTTRTALLPDAEQLFATLARLPAPADLDAWVRAQGMPHNRRALVSPS